MHAMDTLAARIEFIRGSQSRRSFAQQMDTTESTLRNYEKGVSVPDAIFLENVCKKLRILPEWLLLGRGPMHQEEDSKQALLAELHKKANDIIEKNNDIVMIPLVDAVLSAGGGSFETNGSFRKEYAFRRDFILRKGNPSDMVLMRVSGDSMVPDVLNGDVALIDQSKTKIVPGQMYAVGFEESIYLKRIDNLPGKVILKSANPAYPPVELDTRGDLSAHFRVIGRVLWIGREYK